MKNIFNYILPMVLMFPVVAFAQFGEVDTFINQTSGFINTTLIPILLGFAFLLFIYGVAKFFFIADEDNTESKKEGKQMMLWGIIAFVVIVSIWGIVGLITNGLNLNNNDTLINVPKTPNATGGGPGIP